MPQVRNIFDEIPVDAPVAAPTPANDSANVFDTIPADEAQSEPMDEETYRSTFQSMIADKKVPVKDIISWSETTGGRIVKTPKEVQRWADKVRGGSLAPEAVRMEILGSEVRTPRESKKSGVLESTVRQGRQALTLNWGDELKAFSDAGGVLGYVDSRWNDDGKFWDRYGKEHAEEAELMAGDWEHNPIASGIGYGGGTVGSILLPGGAIAKGGNWLYQGAKLAAMGATGAAVDEAGRSGPGRRLDDVPTAAGIGAVAGPVVGALAPVVGRTGKMVADKTGLTDAIDAAVPKVNAWAKRLKLDLNWDRIPAEIKALATRARLKPSDINRMQEAAQTFRRAGVEPRALDTMSRAEQDVIAAAGRKSTGAARDRLYEEAETTARTMGSRLKDQFQRVTNIRGNSREMGDRIELRRNKAADRAMSAMRDKDLPLNEGIINVMLTGVGKRAIGQALQAADPQTAAAIRSLPKLMKQLEPLGPAAREQVLRQSPHKFTVGVADRMRIALNDMASNADRQGNGGLAREIRQLRDQIRTAAGAADPNYRKYLENYAEDSKTLEAIDLGAEAFSRNTDEFVPKAQALSDEPNAVINTKDLAPAQGEYEVLNTYEYQGGGQYTIRRKMPDGNTVDFNISIPPPTSRIRTGEPADMATVSVDSRIDGRHMSYGNEAAYNEFGPEMVEDAARFFRQQYGAQYPHIRAVTGQRVGGMRGRAARDRDIAMMRRQNEAEREAGVTREYDDDYDVMATGGPSAGRALPTQQERETAQRMYDEYQESVDAGNSWEEPDHFLEEVYDLGRPGAEPPAAVVQEFRDLVRNGGRFRDYEAEAAAGARAEADVDRENLAGFMDRTGFNVEATADDLGDLLEDYAGPPLTRTDIRGMSDEVNWDEPGAVEFADEVARVLNARIASRTGGEAPVQPDAPAAARGEAVSDDVTSNGLTFDEVRAQYDDYLRAEREAIAEGGVGDPPMTFAEWAGENFYSFEVPETMWERIRNTARDLGQDETGSKRLPGGDDTRRYEERTIPPSAESLREPVTQSGSGVRNTGRSVRERNERPASLNRGASFHPVRPREVDAPSDRQLAVGEMGRELERRTGESARAPFEMGNKMAYAPEQLARNEGLMGTETAAELQRAMDATMRQAANTARVNPGAGSPTALRSQDDAALTEMMNFFGSVATGGKSGMFQGVLQVLRGSGMTETQMENLVLRVMDPKQTDQVLQELAQYVGPENAQQLLSVLMAAQARSTGAVVAPGQPPEE